MARSAALLAARFNRPLVAHRGESGRRREDELRAILQDFLPRRFAVSSGEAVSATGEVSHQLDIIIYDALETPVFDRGPSSVVIPIEGLLAAVEVASRLDSSKLAQDAAKLGQLKRMTRSAWTHGDGGPPRFPAFGDHLEAFPIQAWIFGYEGIGDHALSTQIVALDRDTAPEHRVDGVAVLGRTLLGNASHTKPIKAFPEDGTHRHGWNETQPGHVLLLFMTLLTGLLSHARANSPIAIAMYMDMSTPELPSY